MGTSGQLGVGLSQRPLRLSFQNSFPAGGLFMLLASHVTDGSCLHVPNHGYGQNKVVSVTHHALWSPSFCLTPTHPTPGFGHNVHYNFL